MSAGGWLAQHGVFELPVLLRSGFRKSGAGRRRRSGRHLGLASGRNVVGGPELGGHDLAPGRGYLVTGCAGFIGSHLTEALVDRGCWVLGVDKFTDNYARSIKERNLEECCARGNVRFSELDLAKDPVEPLVEQVSGVFHLAARPGVRTSWGSTFPTYLRDNLLATQRVFEAAVERGVRVVYASSSSIYGDAEEYPLREDATPVPVSPYGVSKLACEGLATSYGRSAGLDAVGLRYFSVYGPRQRPDMAFAGVFDCLANDHPFRVLGSGRQTRDFTYVGDIVEGTLRAMKHGTSGGVYNLGGGSEISLMDSLALCERVAGRRLDLHHVAAATGDARRTIADFSRARFQLGWKPTTSLEAGLLAQSEHTLLGRVQKPLAWAQPA